MTDYVIPCDTIARLTHVLRNMPPEADDHFKTIRIDHGVAVASNRNVMACELIGGSSGVIHLIPSPALVENCRKEAPFASNVTITVNEALRFAVAKTTFGYIEPGNCCLWSSAPTDFDKWRDIALSTKQPATVNRGGMFWNTDDLRNVADASPSGRLIFEESIDTQGRPTVIRDVNDYNWFAIFRPFAVGESGTPAVLPSWLVSL